jgi:hypothetical protein
MRLAIIGSRNFTDWNLLESKIDELKLKPTEIVSGGAKGADSLGEKYAKMKNIPIKIYKPDWEKYGKAAGVIRNEDIINYSDRVIAFWDGKSKGTKNSIDHARKLSKKVYIISVG